MPVFVAQVVWLLLVIVGPAVYLGQQGLFWVVSWREPTGWNFSGLGYVWPLCNVQGSISLYLHIVWPMYVLDCG